MGSMQCDVEFGFQLSICFGRVSLLLRNAAIARTVQGKPLFLLLRLLHSHDRCLQSIYSATAAVQLPITRRWTHMSQYNLGDNFVNVIIEHSFVCMNLVVVWLGLIKVRFC